MNGITDNFLWPVLVAVIGGLTMSWIKLARQRSAIRNALISEINLLLRQAADYREYLSQEPHDWLTEGMILSESPVFVASPKRVFNTVLLQLWLFPSSEVQKVLRFYSHIEDCETLIQILFERIQKQEDAGKPLEARQIAVTKSRIKRIIKGLDSAIRVTDGKIDKLGQLPTTYALPTARDSSKELALVFKVGQKRKKSRKDG
jgi:hypothetical protein